jgi:hypothetical protein
MQIISIVFLWDFSKQISTIYNMSGRVVSDIQTRAEGESLYIRYNTDANEFIGEVMSSLAK